MPEEAIPGGFLYREDFLTGEEHARLLEIFTRLPFRHAQHKGYDAQRRVVGFGWEGGTIPAFLLPFRDRAAAFAGIADPATITSALISEYSPGTSIGWHRDKPTVGHVLGVSLGSTCQFRLRRQRRGTSSYDRFSVPAEPRSIYCMAGESRRDWQHSIPAVAALRYSITFRDF
jgi:alkylated DNA repair dioxygenase AlkB